MEHDSAQNGGTSTTLLAACRYGGEEPLRELHAFVRPVLERWAKRARRAGSPDFEDFFNECWVRIQIGVMGGSYARGTPFRAWVGVLARYVLLELGRARIRSGAAPLPEEELATPDPLERCFDEEWSRELRSRALRLTDDQTHDAVVFRAFVMRCLEDAAYPTIAAHLGLGTDKKALDLLYKQIHRVRETFEQNLRIVFARMS